MLEVRTGRPEDADGCVAVLAALPEYFTPETHDDLRTRFDTSRVVVAAERGLLVGFALLEEKQAGGEIHYAAVLPDRRRAGIGRRLVTSLLDDVDGPIVEVKTLDESSGYEPYVATRAFWESLGFVQIDCIDPLPGWNPGNPSAIYVCALRPTRTGSSGTV